VIFPKPFLGFLACITLGGWSQAETLHGRIVNRLALAEDGNAAGLSGARVLLLDSSGRLIHKAASGKSGDYRLPSVKAGAYTLSLSMRGYLPNPLIREIRLAPDDTSGLWLYLDPVSPRTLAASPGKSKKTSVENYGQLAEGVMESAKQPAFWTHGNDEVISLSRFFDASNRSPVYSAFWAGMLWSEIEAQNRSLYSKVKFAQALDSGLRAKDIAVRDLAGYRDIEADSILSLHKTLRAIAYNRSLNAKTKTPPHPRTVKSFGLSRAMTLDVALEALESPGLPTAQRKNLAAKLRGHLGAEGNRRLAAAVAKKPAPENRRNAPPSPEPSGEQLWAKVTETLKKEPGHPVARFHLGRRAYEQKDFRLALRELAQAEKEAPGYTALLKYQALACLAAQDTVQAQTAYSALIAGEDAEGQAWGLRGQAAIQLAGGRGEEAEQSLWRAQGLDPHSPQSKDALYALAELALAHGKENQVEALLDAQTKSEPKNPRPYFWLGKLALKNNQDGLAASHFQKAADLAPKEAVYAEALARLKADVDEWQATLKILLPHRKDLSPDGLSLFVDALLRTGRSAEAVEESAKLYRQMPGTTALARWAQALTAARQPEKAIALIEKSEYAGDEVIQVLLALAKMNIGDVREAEKILTPIAEAHPTDPILHLHLGKAFYAQRDYRKASREFREALRFRDNLSDALYHQGLCCLKLGRPGESHHYFLELADKNSLAWKAKGLLGRGQAFVQEDKLEAAEESLRRSFAIAPEAETAAHLAMVLLKAGKKSEAETWARKATELDRGLALGTMALSDALIENGKNSEGLAVAEKGLIAHAKSCEHLVAAAKANYRNGKDDRAKELGETARQLCPDSPGPHFYLGVLSARAGSTPEAKRHFQAYLDAGGESGNVPRGYR